MVLALLVGRLSMSFGRAKPFSRVMAKRGLSSRLSPMVIKCPSGHSKSGTKSAEGSSRSAGSHSAWQVVRISTPLVTLAFFEAP